MKKGKPFIDALADLFDEIELETPEEIDTVLREAGYEPDEVGRRMAAAAQKALNKTKVKYGF
jgi:hypothetical protein